MSQNISTYITYPAITLVASATAHIDVRISDVRDMRVFLDQNWPGGTGSVTGVAVNLYPGWGGKDPAENSLSPIPNVVSNPASANIQTIPQFSGNYLAVTQSNGMTSIVQPAISQSASANPSTSTSFYFNSILSTWPQWVRFEIINLDSTQAVNVSLLADI